MSSVLLALDQGTTSSRVVVFSQDGTPLFSDQHGFTQHYPQPGWVEHEAEDIWHTSLQALQTCLRYTAEKKLSVAGIGVTNQRETTLVWDKRTGKALHRAIVWQDRRTADFCQDLKDQGLADWFQERTGLLLDPYFSATKVRWLLDHVPEARSLAAEGHLAFGTVDSYLLFRLTGGQVHATDATNACRTGLLNLETGTWDTEILDRLDIPSSILPAVQDTVHRFGTTDTDTVGTSLPLYAVAGDQQAATVGQACLTPGMAKATYGTGCFALLNTGTQLVRSQHNLLSTIAYRLKGETTYALEGSLFMAGAVMEWLQQSLGLFETAEETAAIAAGLEDTGGVYLIPAFVGLGAPHWQPNARAALVGMTRGTDKRHIIRAGLEAVAYQTNDLMQAMAQDHGQALATLRIDGGMANNPWFCQFLSDILDIPLAVPHTVETTALGAAWLAGLGAGVYDDLEQAAQNWRESQSYQAHLASDKRTALLDGWHEALGRVTQ